MSLQEEYKEKIEAQIKPFQDKLVELRVYSDKYMTKANIKYAQPVEQLEDMAHTMMIKLTELGNLDGDAWKALRNEVEIAVEAFCTSVKDTSEKFNSEENPI
jgi:hypothetical protein